MGMGSKSYKGGRTMNPICLTCWCELEQEEKVLWCPDCGRVFNLIRLIVNLKPYMFLREELDEL